MYTDSHVPNMPKIIFKMKQGKYFENFRKYDDFLRGSGVPALEFGNLKITKLSLLVIPIR